MPTFRGYLDDEETIKREKEFLSFLDEKLTDDQILYVNLHHHISQGLDCSEFKHIHTFPPLIDSYELLTATDALISDYSSVFFDYLVLGKRNPFISTTYLFIILPGSQYGYQRASI